MTQVCFVSTYFSAEHIFDLAKNPSRAWHNMWAILVNPKSFAHLATVPFLYPEGYWAKPERYVGHMGLDTHSGAHSGPRRTCAPFAATLSVRIFGHFSSFSIFLVRPALCSDPPCSPDALTHHVGEPNRPLIRSYAKVCVNNFAILALVGLVLHFSMPWPIEIFPIQVCVGLQLTPIVSGTER